MEDLPGKETATRSDLGALEERFDLKVQALEHKLTGIIHERINGVLEQIAAVRSDISTQTRLMVLALIGTVATVAALAFAAPGLS